MEYGFTLAVNYYSREKKNTKRTLTFNKSQPIISIGFLKIQCLKNPRISVIDFCLGARTIQKAILI